MATVGRKLLSAVVLSGDIQEYLKLSLGEYLFRDTEVELYEAINNHIIKYGKVPSKQTLEDKGFSEGLDETTEPPAYYMEGLESRYLRSSMKKIVVECNSLLVDEQESVAFDKMLEGITNLHRSKNRTTLHDFRNSLNLVWAEYVKKNVLGDDHALKFGWEKIDGMTGGMTGGDFVTFVGRPACLSGDTLIWVSRKKDSSGRQYTLKQLYERFNGGAIPCARNLVKYWDKKIPTRINSLKSDGYTGLNEVNAVVHSGVKPTYTVVTSTGKTIRATLEHKFKTAEGFKELKELAVGDAIICRGGSLPKSVTPKRLTKEVCGKYPYSPYRTRNVGGYTYQRISMPRLIYDAGINGLHPDDFLLVIRNNPNHQLVFSNLEHHIHHLDGDWANNSFSNLSCIAEKEHQQLHNKNSAYVRRFNKYEVQDEFIMSITYYGEEDTYDICMNYPDNNYVANDFVVHNSGKTFKLLYIAYKSWLQGRRPLFVSMEMNALIINQRLAAMHTKLPLTHILKANLSSVAVKSFQKKLVDAGTADNPLWVVDGNLTSTVDDIVMLCRQLNITDVYVDGAYLLRHSNPKISKWQRIAENAEGLKQRVAQELNIPVIASYQFSKPPKKNKMNKEVEKAGIDDIYGSDEIAQLSTVVMGLFENEGIETQLSRKVSILKGRNGEQGEFAIRWNFNQMDFSQILTKEDHKSEAPDEQPEHYNDLDYSQ